MLTYTAPHAETRIDSATRLRRMLIVGGAIVLIGVLPFLSGLVGALILFAVTHRAHARLARIVPRRVSAFAIAIGSSECCSWQEPGSYRRSSPRAATQSVVGDQTGHCLARSHAARRFRRHERVAGVATVTDALLLGMMPQPCCRARSSESRQPSAQRGTPPRGDRSGACVEPRQPRSPARLPARLRDSPNGDTRRRLRGRSAFRTHRRVHRPLVLSYFVELLGVYEDTALVAGTIVPQASDPLGSHQF